MNKHLLRLAFILLSACSLWSCTKDEMETTGTIIGKVTDPSGENIANVTMTLSPGGMSRTTGNDGTFEMIDLTPGQYTLQAQKSGYNTNTKTVVVVAGQTASGDMRLTPVSHEAEIAVSPSSLAFGTTQTELALTITNNGNATTQWSVDLGAHNWLTATPSAGQIAARKTQSIVFSVDRNKITEYKSVVVNVSSNGSSYPISISCSPANSKGAEMVVSPKLLDFGSTIQKLSFEVKNIGEADLTWNIKQLTEPAITVSAQNGVVAPGGSNLVYVVVDRTKVTADIQTSFAVSDGTRDEAITVKISKDGSSEGGNEEQPGEEVAETVVTEGLYVYYKFNGDFNDATENAVPAFGQNNPTFVDGVASGSQAVKFSRSNNSFVNVSSSIMDRKEMTISFWGKDFSDGNIFYTLNSDNETIHSLTMHQNSLKYIASEYYLTYRYSSTGTFTHPTLNDGQWHHIALTIDYSKTAYDKVTSKLYVDGNLVDVMSQNVDNSSDTYGCGMKFVLGGSAKFDTSIAGTNMSVDNFRVYDSRSLSAQEVKAIYNAKQ